MQIDNKLQKFYSFHTEVTTIFNSVDLNVLIMSGMITKPEIFQMVIEHMTAGYAKMILTELHNDYVLIPD